MTLKKLIVTWIILLLLTIVIVVLSNHFSEKQLFTTIILFISVGKFLLIAFYFLELYKAHSFWKLAVILFSLFFVLTLLFI
ncbi:MAG: cytochrome C oxidase subunit IV family protein [Flavobacteriaceae bacterium]|nr:cytochrome C oxidase subunit IV family protein [Flavobacteriaceae bacterium]